MSVKGWQSLAGNRRDRLGLDGRAVRICWKRHDLMREDRRENPWNAVTRNLPLSPSRLLLAAARLAADYCRMSEYLFMNAARSGGYVPPGWRPGPESADAHEESEARGDAAARRHDEIDALYERIFGELLD